MMTEYIERETVISRIRIEQSSHQTLGERMSVNEAVAVIEEMPTADVVPLSHGEWIPISDGDGAECSECGGYLNVSENGGMAAFRQFRKFYAVCPACGAKMDRSDEQ